MNKKYFISLSIAAALTIGSLPTLATTASANSSVEDLKKQQDDVSSKKEEINGKISEKNSQIDQTINKQKDLESQIAEISTKLKDTETKIAEKTKEIDCHFLADYFYPLHLTQYFRHQGHTEREIPFGLSDRE